MNKKLLPLVISLGCVGSVFAVEAIPTGQLQVQGSYADPKIDDSHWRLAMPESFVGITAVEPLDGNTLVGYWQVGIDPLSEEDEAVFEQQKAYLNLRLGTFGLWAGRLPTLEQVYLEDPFGGLMSLPNKGMAVSSEYEDSMLKAVRFDASSGEYLALSGQWVIDETKDSLELSLAASVQTPEGRFSVTYRKPEEGADIWGNQITWKSGTVALSGAWIYQKELVAWDAEARFDAQTLQTFVGYSKDKDGDSRWSLGGMQNLSPNASYFSEIMRWTDDSRWQWSTGLRMTF